MNASTGLSKVASFSLGLSMSMTGEESASHSGLRLTAITAATRRPSFQDLFPVQPAAAARSAGASRTRRSSIILAGISRHLQSAAARTSRRPSTFDGGGDRGVCGGGRIERMSEIDEAEMSSSQSDLVAVGGRRRLERVAETDGETMLDAFGDDDDDVPGRGSCRVTFNIGSVEHTALTTTKRNLVVTDLGTRVANLDESDEQIIFVGNGNLESAVMSSAATVMSSVKMTSPVRMMSAFSMTSPVTITSPDTVTSPVKMTSPVVTMTLPVVTMTSPVVTMTSPVNASQRAIHRSTSDEINDKTLDSTSIEFQMTSDYFMTSPMLKVSASERPRVGENDACPERRTIWRNKSPDVEGDKVAVAAGASRRSISALSPRPSTDHRVLTASSIQHQHSPAAAAAAAAAATATAIAAAAANSRRQTSSSASTAVAASTTTSSASPAVAAATTSSASAAIAAATVVVLSNQMQLSADGRRLSAAGGAAGGAAAADDAASNDSLSTADAVLQCDLTNLLPLPPPTSTAAAVATAAAAAASSQQLANMQSCADSVSHVYPNRQLDVEVRHVHTSRQCDIILSGNRQSDTSLQPGDRQSDTSLQPGDRKSGTSLQLGDRQSDTSLQPGDRKSGTSLQPGGRQFDSDLQAGIKQAYNICASVVGTTGNRYTLDVSRVGTRLPYGADPAEIKLPYGADPAGTKLPYSADQAGTKLPYGADPAGKKLPSGADEAGTKHVRASSLFQTQPRSKSVDSEQWGERTSLTTSSFDNFILNTVVID